MPKMKSYSQREIVKMLEADGWVLDRVAGAHQHFKHPTKPGIVTVPHHGKELKRWLQRKILKDAGLL